MKNILWGGWSALGLLGLLALSGNSYAACTTQTITVGQTVNGALDSADCVITYGSSQYYTDVYSFTATAGQQIYITNSSAAIDVDLTLMYPDLATTYDDDGGEGTNSRLPADSGYLTLPTSGVYQIYASTATTLTTGSYTMQLLSSGGGEIGGTTQDAIEYYHSGFGHYFITAFPDEAVAIDAGAVQGWTRTGRSFKVYESNASGLNTVCRFFSTSFAPKSSHFYTPFSDECNAVKQNADWQFEANAFYVQTSDITGACPSGTSKVYRLYNNGLSGAPNHRYTADAGVRSQMLSQGWISEGYGSDGVIFCTPGSSGETVPPLKTSLADYNTAVDDVAKSNLAFLQANLQWEGANLSSLTASEVATLANNFLNTGTQMVTALETLNTTAANISSSAASGSSTGSNSVIYAGTRQISMAQPLDLSSDAAGVVDISGVSPGLAIETGAVIQGAKDGVSACNALFDSDPNAYKTCIDKLRQKQLLKAAGLGFSTVVGTGAAIIAGGAASAAAAPAAVVIGGAALAAYTVGKTVSWMWNYCSGASADSLRNKPLAVAGETCSLSSGQTNAGTKIPNTMTAGGTLVISIPGYVPVVIKNFTPPADGSSLTIDFTPVPIDQAEPGTIITIENNEVPVTGSSCSEILSASVTTNPQDPGPSQSVTVIARVFPVVSGCTVSFSMSGTDGYSKSSTPTTDSSGTASFYIPGGAAGVHDAVTITVNGFTYSVTYTF